MFYSYHYFNHAIGQLHAEVRGFLWNLRRSDLRPSKVFPERFRIRKWCGPRLTEIAEAHNSQLPGLLSDFYHAYKDLAREERRKLYSIFRVMNKVEILCSGELPHYDITSIPAGIRAESKALFLYLFKSLEKQSHYQLFFRKLAPNRRYCPFCGLGNLFVPADQTQDYDHCIFKADYPFAAINPRNLAPMCERCNRTYKEEKPLLLNAARTRRKAFYPYKDHGMDIGISLAGSQRPAGLGDQGNWILKFTPRNEEVETWEDVFELPNRYVQYELHQHYDAWLRQFESWALEDLKPVPGPSWGEADIRAAANKHAAFWFRESKIPEKLLRSEVFRFLAEPINEPFLRSLASSWERKRNQHGLA